MKKICAYTQRLIPSYFPKYYKNPHVGIFKHRYLSFYQRAGVWFFTILLRTHTLGIFTRLFYIFAP
jgi:hypothetical protein